ncbi:MAG: hypothetical protein ON057_000996 [Glomeribacter sp. 1016415]|nr:hypothetical protein [Glomeribacter sp. 1016415]
MSKLITVLAASFLMSATAFAATGEYSATAPVADAAATTAPAAAVASTAPAASKETKKTTHAGKHASKKAKEASTGNTSAE